MHEDNSEEDLEEEEEEEEEAEEEMNQEELNKELFWVCGGRDTNFDRAVDMLDRGADPCASFGGINALQRASIYGHVQLVGMLLERGAVLDATSHRGSALILASLHDMFEVCLLLIARGADLRLVNEYAQAASTHYGVNAGLTDPAVKAQRVAELEAAFRAGSHPSQVQRRKDEAWARRGAFMQVMAESRFQPLLHVLVDDLKTALPTDAKLPDEPTETEEQRRALLHRKVFGLKHVVRGVAGFM
jgi:hypothetical protein